MSHCPGCDGMNHGDPGPPGSGGECPGCTSCAEKDQRIAEMELALRACEAAVDSQAARIADLEEDLAQAREGHANAH